MFPEERSTVRYTVTTTESMDFGDSKKVTIERDTNNKILRLHFQSKFLGFGLYKPEEIKSFIEMAKGLLFMVKGE